MIEQYVDTQQTAVAYRAVFTTLVGVARTPAVYSFPVSEADGTEGTYTPQCDRMGTGGWYAEMGAISWASPRRVVYAYSNGTEVDAIIVGSDDNILYCWQVQTTSG